MVMTKTKACWTRKKSVPLQMRKRTVRQATSPDTDRGIDDQSVDMPDRKRSVHTVF